VEQYHSYEPKLKLKLARLMQSGDMPVAQISREYQVTRSLLYYWWQQYRERGEAAFAPPLLSPEQQEELDQALDQPPTDGSLWNGPKVAAWMTGRLGREVDPRRGWDYLQRLGRSSRVPRPQHEESSEAEQAAFKKTARGNQQASPSVPRSPG
jgi:transposase